MNRYLASFLAGVTLACLLVSFSGTALAVVETPAQMNVIDSAKANALTLLKAGDFPQAYDAYMRLLREAPDDDDVNMGLAVASFRSGRYNQSVMAYERMIEKYPSRVALYQGLAQSYIALGDNDNAQRALLRAKELGANVSDKDLENIKDTMDRQSSLWQVHGQIRTGLQYNTNANQGLKNDEVRLGQWNVTLTDAKQLESAGAFLQANIDVARRFEPDSRWWIVGDLSAHIRGYENSELSNQTTRYFSMFRAGLGVRYLGTSVLVDIRNKTEFYDYEFEQSIKAYGPEGTFLWAVDPSVHLITRAGIEHRTYSETPERNGHMFTVGESVRFYFGEANHSITLGGRLYGARSEFEVYSYNGMEASASLNLKLPYGFEVSPYAVYAKDKYEKPATVLETKLREDEFWSVGGAVSYRIDKNWSVDVGHQYTEKHSTSEMYKYDQHVTTVGLSWSF